MNRGTYIQVASLPETLQRTLKNLGYNKKDIECRIVESVEYSNSAYANGWRGSSTMVNLSTGESQTLESSWGGDNIFSKNAMDKSLPPAVLPEGFALIKLQSSDKVFGSLYLNPKNILPCLNQTNSLSREQYIVLKAVSTLIPSHRKAYYEKHAAILPSLFEAGWLIKKGNGISISTEGKNQWINYEQNHKDESRFI
jgi:hypothetical protein